MQHTLVAVFDNRTDAQNAMNELLSSNFSRQDVRLSNADPTGMTDSVSGASATNTDADEGSGIGASIKHFFTDLFGADNSEHASRYEGAVTRGHHVLTVTADSLPEVERAADIVERYGPTDIDEQASDAGSMGAMGGMSATPESMRMSGAGGMQQNSGMSMQSGGGINQQLENAGDRKLFAQQSLNQAEPMGQTYQEPMGKSGLSATGGTSLQGTTLQENSVQGSALDGTQKSDTSFQSSGIQGGTLQGSTSSHAIQTPGSGLGADPVGSATHAHLGSQQLDSGSLGGAGGASQQRGGVRIYSRTAGARVNDGTSAMSGLGDDDSYYRDHFNSSLGDSDMDYDSVKPAYSYGSEMRKSELYRNRPWDDVEGDLARAWDSRISSSGTGTGSTAGSTGGAVSGAWDKMKSAVRHGWDRVTDDDDDDREYRSHWNATYSTSSDAGSYDDFKPAYAYGSSMAQDPKYRGRQWGEVENDLRSDWDTRYGSGGQSTWDKMKSAVRHGWDRMTS